jgi:NAD(P)H dehydrogenase (quinone)
VGRRLRAGDTHPVRHPHGFSNASGGKSDAVSEAELASARYQGRRLAEVTAKLVA